MERSDFIFTIGYQGNTAIVDATMRTRYGACSTSELFEKGLYRAAFSSALFSGNTEELEWFCTAFGKKTAPAGQPAWTRETLQRLFGVYGVPEGVSKIKAT